MKIIKSIFSALFGITAVVGLVACSSDDYSRIGAPDGSQVFFSNLSSYEYLLAENQNKVDVEISRVKTDEAQTVTIVANDASGLFTVASSVSFAAGDSIAKIPVTFDFSKLQVDTDYDITLTAKDAGSEYGDFVKTITIKYAPWTDWEPYGWDYPSTAKTFAEWEAIYAKATTEAEYAKDGIIPVFSYKVYFGGDYAQPVFYRESQLDPTKAQIMLYSFGTGVNLTFDWDKTNNHLTAPALYFDNDDRYGAVYVSDAVTYYNNVKGKPTTWEKYPTAYDPENGRFTLYISYYVSEGSFGSGPEYLQLPGFEKADYSLTLEDKGVATSAKGEAFGEVLNFGFGADLGSVKYATFEGTLTEEEVEKKADAIVDGSVVSTKTTEAGFKTISVDAEGDYTLVAALYDNDGNYKEHTSIAFTVKSVVKQTWTPIYTGDFVYSIFFTNEDESPYTDSGLTLYQCNEDKSLYKIEHWGYDVDFTFTMDSDGKIVVQDQYTGYTSSSNGEVWVMELSDYVGKTMSPSYYEEGVFNFGVVYYVSAGNFGYGYETFSVSGSAAKAIAKAVKASGVKKAKLGNKSPKITKNASAAKRPTAIRGLKPTMK